MIIEARDDVVTLEGSLVTNQWSAIQAPANLLLRFHPNGILIDAGGITRCTEDGARTFLDAMDYIERHRARIVVCHPPPEVQETLKNIPNLRSQLAIAATCEEGRASLDMASSVRRRNPLSARAADSNAVRPRLVMVPLVDAGLPDEAALVSLRNCIALAVEIGMRRRGRVQTGSDEADDPEISDTVSPTTGRNGSGSFDRILPLVHLVAVLEVPRAMPINTPLLDEEQRLRNLLDIGSALCDSLGVSSQSSVSRAREAGEEIALQASNISAEIVVLPLPQTGAPGVDNLSGIADSVLQRAYCEIVFSS